MEANYYYSLILQIMQISLLFVLGAGLFQIWESGTLSHLLLGSTGSAGQGNHSHVGVLAPPPSSPNLE